MCAVTIKLHSVEVHRAGDVLTMSDRAASVGVQDRPCLATVSRWNESSSMLLCCKIGGGGQQVIESKPLRLEVAVALQVLPSGTPAGLQASDVKSTMSRSRMPDRTSWGKRCQFPGASRRRDQWEVLSENQLGVHLQEIQSDSMTFGELAGPGLPKS